jgi:hypothetical protein
MTSRDLVLTIFNMLWRSPKARHNFLEEAGLLWAAWARPVAALHNVDLLQPRV